MLITKLKSLVLTATKPSLAPPITEDVEVLSDRSYQSRFAVTTTISKYTAEVGATSSGSYHRPKIPPLAQNLDFSLITKRKRMMDIVGHYSGPELLQLQVNTDEQTVMKRSCVK